MIFDRNENKEVIALLGAGSMGTAIVRKIAAGRKISISVKMHPAILIPSVMMTTSTSAAPAAKRTVMGSMA